jgi:glucokinase
MTARDPLACGRVDPPRPHPATAVGVDVGASWLKLALVDQAGSVLRSTIRPTPRGGDGPQIVADIVAAIVAFGDSALPDPGHAPDRPRGTGIVVPHFVDGPQWTQRGATNMPALEGLAMRPLLTARLAGELAMANDVSAATIAEHVFGLGRGVDRLLVMSIGTGISIGVIVDGELLQYTWGTAGDTGHIVVDTAGMHACSCGSRGCLETVASGAGILQAALRAVRRGESTVLAVRSGGGKPFSAEDVAEAARQGDVVAQRIFGQAAFFLGQALASYLQIFRPELIVLAGGVAASGDLLLDGIRRSLHELAGPAQLSALQGVELSAFPRLGAAIGSASLILHPGRYLRDGTVARACGR